MTATDSEVYRAFAARVRAQLATTRKGDPTVNDTTTSTTETGEAPVPATFLAAPDGAPCETYPWCVELGSHVDHVSRAVSLPTAEGLPPILTAHFYTDQPAGLPSLDFDPGYDDWREGITSDQLRTEVARVRAHLVRLDAFADEYDAITEAGTAGVLHRTAAYVTEQGVTPEQAEALDAVAHAVIEDGDPDGAGRALADALAAQPDREQGPGLDLADPAAVSAHFLGLAEGVVHSARLAADPRLSDPAYRVVPADADDWFRHLHAAEISAHTARTTGGAGNPDEAFHQRRILALIQAYAQYWGSGHGRTLRAEYAAQLADAAVFLTTEAVTASLTGLETNPHDVADRLHRAIDRAQAKHLVDILPDVYTADSAYSNERFCTAERAMADAVKYSRDQALTVTGLRAALDLNLIRDAAPAAVRAEYTPPADHEDAETIKTAGASGAILKAYLHTPREIDGTQTGPRVLAVYSEDSADDELDLDGALHLREQVAALLPNLDAMVAVLAADEATRQDGGQQR